MAALKLSENLKEYAIREIGLRRAYEELVNRIFKGEMTVDRCERVICELEREVDDIDDYIDGETPENDRKMLLDSKTNKLALAEFLRKVKDGDLKPDDVPWFKGSGDLLLYLDWQDLATGKQAS